MEYIEFQYDTVDGRILEIEGQIDGHNISFKAFEGTAKISKGLLKEMDILNIEDFIRHHSEPEIHYESDLYERQND